MADTVKLREALENLCGAIAEQIEYNARPGHENGGVSVRVRWARQQALALLASAKELGEGDSSSTAVAVPIASNKQE